MSNRIAALDLGTNSFHLLIASIDSEKQEVRLERRVREFVFLGRELGGEPPCFSEEALVRGLGVLRSFVKLCQEMQVSRILACGTEAFRQAQNASLLIEAAKHELGIMIRILSGVEEARLIHEGVKNGLPLPEEPYLLMDIGGGSVEFILGKGGEILHLTSLPLGVTTLAKLFPEPDPFSPNILSQIQTHVHKILLPFLSAIPKENISYLIGSSGTFKTLARLIAHHSGDNLSAQTIHGYQFSPMLFYPIYKKLTTLPLSERLRLKGMQAERAPYMPYGAVLVERILQALPISRIIISEYALREGIIYEYAKQLLNGSIAVGTSLREKSVRALGDKYQINTLHAQHTREWAEKLFDLLRPLHHLTAQEKEWLAYAAYLHDIGHFINPSGHHKHGLYILLNSPMPGFSPEELLVIANLVRYHRKSIPSSDHFHYSALPRSQKKIIGYLAPILRLSDQLAKYLHHGPHHVSVAYTDTNIEISADTPEGNVGQYIPAIIAEVQDFFERSYNRHFSLQLAWQPGLSG
ncbi:MAG: Ppx/GppA phosphatase family protein [Bacteroidia bacterium]|nr:Ppx/GppA family phosphatase [Bacteroidia bacterium]MDW8133920.1 Ppx/GppA phosphatase family protein [Bacteroidia bacterium]